MDVLPVDRSIYRFVDGLVNDKSGSKDGATIFSYIDDPTVMGFNFVIDFNSKGNELFSQGPAYLRSIDEPQRAANLEDFTARLKDLIFKFPYYFQSVTGLKDLYKMDPTFGMRTKDRVLEFKTLESIDLRVGNMIDKYMKAYFEEEYYREMIPQNLRRFSFWLVVSEIRNFKSYFTKISQAAQYAQYTGQGSASSYPSKGFSIKSINDMFNCYVYRFNNCEFDFSSSNGWMDELDQKGKSEFSSNSFKIKIGNMEEMHKMDMIGAMTGIGDTSTAAYRRAIYGVPSDLGEISFNDSLAGEKQLSGSSWLDKMTGFIKSTPAYVSLAATLDPDNLKRTVKNLAIGAIQDMTGKLLSKNVFDTVNGAINYDFQSAIEKIINNNNGNNGGGTIVGKNVFPRTNAPTHFMSESKIPGLDHNDNSREALLGETLAGMATDDRGPVVASLGNVFGYRPIAAILNNSLVAGTQAATTNNNSIQ